MKYDKIAVGSKGEQAVAEYLSRHRLEVFEMNYRCKTGEIDIVAKAGDGCLVFIEVKTRRGDECGQPIEAVTKAKRAKIINTAKRYLCERELYGTVDVRFDIAEVFDDSPELRIEYYENAFIEGD